MYPKKMSLNCEQFFLNLIYSLYFHLKHRDDGVLQHYISESWSKMQNGQEEEVPVVDVTSRFITNYGAKYLIHRFWFNKGRCGPARSLMLLPDQSLIATPHGQ